MYFFLCNEEEPGYHAVNRSRGPITKSRVLTRQVTCSRVLSINPGSTAPRRFSYIYCDVFVSSQYSVECSLVSYM